MGTESSVSFITNFLFFPPCIENRKCFIEVSVVWESGVSPPTSKRKSSNEQLEVKSISFTEVAVYAAGSEI